MQNLCFRLIGLFLDTESGHHVRHPVIKYVKVHAFRFEPLEPRGIVDVDGEVCLSACASLDHGELHGYSLLESEGIDSFCVRAVTPGCGAESLYR